MSNEIVDAKSLHKLFVTSLFVAYKYLNELDIWFLEDFSKLAGITKNELEKCEQIFFLDLLDCRCFIEDKAYLRGLRCLERYSGVSY